MYSTFKKYFIEVPALSKKLKPKGSLSCCLLVLQMWWFLISRKIFFLDKKMVFKLSLDGYHFSLSIYNNYDFLTFRTLHLREDYDLSRFDDARVIVDAGANVGFMTLILRAKFPNAKIYALEPVDGTYKRLLENVSSDKNIYPMKVGLSDINGKQYFDVNPLLSFGSSIAARGDGFSKETVRVITLQDLYKEIEEEVDLFKFDIEGSEDKVFVEESLILRSKNYVGEVHGDLMDISTEDFMKRFQGYDVISKPVGSKRIVFSASIK